MTPDILPDLATRIYKPFRKSILTISAAHRSALVCRDKCSCMLATSADFLHLLPQSSRRCVQLGGRSNTLPISKVRAYQRWQHKSHTGLLSNVLCDASTRRTTTDRNHPARARHERDPGHWDLSPEWWGTQAAGWGHDAGVPAFMQHSHCGNGQV